MIDHTTKKRFWSKVRIVGSGCWHWTGARTSSGYGNFWLQGKYASAHRMSWLLNQGNIPNGLCVLHSCDNRRCVNPDHLWLGSKRDNSLDASQKGRLHQVPRSHMRRGEKHGIAKLTDTEALEIFCRYAKRDTTMKTLASEYSVCAQSICNIVNGHTWSHVTGGMECQT